ncbi:hypothetical protein [Enterobacter hormaechei]|uniref:hypothetical protein n=1 Tax=Enterobacter hormaechei TaxID=158836 RepID=UPI001E41DFC2|nr:hypothetical protein [Enterobacter hormaechei]
MSTITRELAKLFRKITNSEIDAEGNAHVVLSPADSLLINNARIALASLEAEIHSYTFEDDPRPLYTAPPASAFEIKDLEHFISFWKKVQEGQMSPGKNDIDHTVWFLEGFSDLTAPPAPVSVPDERYQHLSELYHAQEKRLYKLAQRIKGASFDKYAYSPSQAIDVLESAIFGEREDECRAAILHGADRPQNEPQNIPENIPATQFEPVADLYGLTSPTGGETSFTFDAVEARDFIDGGWLCQEYVELERFQEAITNHTEDKLAMVDHSGDSNNMVEPVTTAYKLPDDFDFDRFNDVVWLEAVASNPHMHSLTTSTIAMVALELNRKLADCNSPVIPDDVQRMDWLVSKTVNVREPLVYGSHNILWSQAITDEQDDHHATKLREQIDAAMADENAAAPQQEVK